MWRRITVAMRINRKTTVWESGLAGPGSAVVEPSHKERAERMKKAVEGSHPQRPEFCRRPGLAFRGSRNPSVHRSVRAKLGTVKNSAACRPNAGTLRCAGRRQRAENSAVAVTIGFGNRRTRQTRPYIAAVASDALTCCCGGTGHGRPSASGDSRRQASRGNRLTRPVTLTASQKQIACSDPRPSTGGTTDPSRDSQ